MDYSHSKGGTTGKPRSSLAPDEERAADARRKAGQPTSPERTDGDRRRPADDAERLREDREAHARQRYDQWLAELPPQIRKAYESGSWDEVPVKWRQLLRAWTLEMAKEVEPGRR